MDRLYIIAMIALICCGTLGLLWVSRAMADEWPVMFSWSYPQPVPEHVRFELRVQPCHTCDLETAGTTGALALTRSYDPDALQCGSFVIVRDSRSGSEIGRLPAVQLRIDQRLMPALRACRLGGDCPGPSAMREMLRDHRERVMPRIVE